MCEHSCAMDARAPGHPQKARAALTRSAYALDATHLVAHGLLLIVLAPAFIVKVGERDDGEEEDDGGEEKDQLDREHGEDAGRYEVSVLCRHVERHEQHVGARDHHAERHDDLGEPGDILRCGGTQAENARTTR